MTLTQEEIGLVRDLVRREAGIVLEADKDYLVDARLSVLARRHGVDSPPEIVQRLRHPADPGVKRAVIEAMTTNETTFFRDIKPFETLRNVVVPEILRRNAASRSLSIWCAASSTGQEPYSIAMTLRDSFPALASWNAKIVASDLSEEVLTRAKAGRFSQLEVNRGLPVSMLVKHFKQDGLEWEISEPLRRMIEFRQLNLLHAWPAQWTSFDAIFIRNVLIYFDIETKRKILGRLRDLMRPGGYLFLGGAETTLNIDDRFERIPLDRSSCYRLRDTSNSPATSRAA